MRKKETALKRLAIAHVDPTKVELGWDLHRRFPEGVDSPRGVARAIRTGCSEVVPELNEAHLEAFASDPEVLAIWRSLGLTSFMCIPLRVHGKTAGAISFFFATESKRRYESNDLRLAEELGHRVSVAIENAYSFRDAQNANRLKDEFLATVSHELRTPLNAILGWAVMLRTTAQGPEAARRGLETIERNARAQARLIEDVLEVSRIIAGNLRLDIRPVDMCAVVRQAVEVVEPMANAKGVLLALALDEAAGNIAGDADRLQQVVWNLVSNAVKFTPKGGTRTRCGRARRVARPRARDRHRRGHWTGTPALRLRSLSAGGQLFDSKARWPGLGTGDRAAPHRAPWRNHPRRQRRRGQGRYLHRLTAHSRRSGRARGAIDSSQRPLVAIRTGARRRRRPPSSARSRVR